MENWQAPIIELKKHIEKSKLTPYEIAKRAKLEPGVIYRLLELKTNPTLKTFTKIAIAAECKELIIRFNTIKAPAKIVAEKP